MPRPRPPPALATGAQAGSGSATPFGGAGRWVAFFRSNGSNRLFPGQALSLVRTRVNLSTDKSKSAKMVGT